MSPTNTNIDTLTTSALAAAEAASSEAPESSVRQTRAGQVGIDLIRHAMDNQLVASTDLVNARLVSKKVNDMANIVQITMILREMEDYLTRVSSFYLQNQLPLEDLTALTELFGALKIMPSVMTNDEKIAEIKRTFIDIECLLMKVFSNLSDEQRADFAHDGDFSTKRALFFNSPDADNTNIFGIAKTYRDAANQEDKDRILTFLQAKLLANRGFVRELIERLPEYKLDNNRLYVLKVGTILPALAREKETKFIVETLLTYAEAGLETHKFVQKHAARLIKDGHLNDVLKLLSYDYFDIRETAQRSEAYLTIFNTMAQQGRLEEARKILEERDSLILRGYPTTVTKYKTLQDGTNIQYELEADRESDKINKYDYHTLTCLYLLQNTNEENVRALNLIIGNYLREIHPENKSFDLIKTVRTAFLKIDSQRENFQDFLYKYYEVTKEEVEAFDMKEMPGPSDSPLYRNLFEESTAEAGITSGGASK